MLRSALIYSMDKEVHIDDFHGWHQALKLIRQLAQFIRIDARLKASHVISSHLVSFRSYGFRRLAIAAWGGFEPLDHQTDDLLHRAGGGGIRLT